ncbi:MAG: M23 family metallopeptidase [Spirochaetaceae bacterium]|nr:M23 family metallopeptidase [Spirochaetaceae bacterium]
MNIKLIQKLCFLGLGLGICFLGVFLFTSIDNSIEKGQGGFESPTRPNLTPIGETFSYTANELDFEEYEDTSGLTYFAYRVKKGDMVGTIAEKFGVTQDTIISVNNIRQSRLIQIGQYLKIPSIPGILYTVKKDGEDINDIAERFEIAPEECAKVNNLDLQLASLKAGDQLFLPNAELDWVTRQEINGDLFKRPLKGGYYFSSYYGWRASPFTGKRTFHGGIDMAARKGTAVYPALDGTVLETGYNSTYGNYIYIKHHSGYKTLYAHLSAINTKKGRFVYTNTVIGEVGSTGLSTGPHLHFSIYKNNVSINPMNLWN